MRETPSAGERDRGGRAEADQADRGRAGGPGAGRGWGRGLVPAAEAVHRPAGGEAPPGAAGGGLGARPWGGHGATRGRRLRRLDSLGRGARSFVYSRPQGNQNYAIGAGTRLDRYRSVVVWCRRFTHAFGAASCRPPADGARTSWSRTAAGPRRAAGQPARRRPGGRLPGRVGGAGRGRARQSDVDVVAVCATDPPAERTRAIVAGLGELAMTWPLRGLELMLDTRARSPPRTGARGSRSTSTSARHAVPRLARPGRRPAHWFLLDLPSSATRPHPDRPSAPRPGRPDPPLLAAGGGARSLAWHDAHEGALEQTVLNASRGWRFAEGVWSSKDDAGAWALARTDDPATVETAWPCATATAPAARPGPRPRLPAPGPGAGRRCPGLAGRGPPGDRAAAAGPAGPGDADEMAGVLADPALHRFTGGRPATLQELRTRYAALAAGSGRPGRSGATGSSAAARRPAGWHGVGHHHPGPRRLDRDRRLGHRRPLAGPGLRHRGGRALVGWLARRDVREVAADIHPTTRRRPGWPAGPGSATTDQVDGEQVWRLPCRR